MSADPSALDPYRSPPMPEGPFPGKPLPGKPGWLTALCVICIVLGVLGLMNSLFGAVGVIGGSAIQKMFTPKGSPGLPAGFEQAQQQLNDDIQAVLRKHLVPLVALLVIRFAVALGLLIGGLRCLSLGEAGRKILIVACALALLFEIGNSIMQSIVNMDNMTAINGFVENMQSSMPQDNQGLNTFMKWWMRGIMVVQIVLLYALSLAKMAVYLFGVIYLQKSRIKALFK